MEYEKALEKAYDKLKEADPKFDGINIPGNLTNAQVAERAVALAWNAVAIALSEKGLDDLIVIDNNNNIKSIPIKSATSRGTNKTAAKGVDVETEPQANKQE